MKIDYSDNIPEEIKDQNEKENTKDETVEEKKETFAEKYYDEIDRQHEKIMSACAKMCRSNKHGFTVTDRLDAIKDLMQNSDYEEIDLGTARVYMHKEFNKEKYKDGDVYLISTHSDTVNSITECKSDLSDSGYYKGTYDNAGTNAAAVIAMLEGDFPPNVFFTFNSEEETGRFKGAKSVVSFLNSLGASDPICIALDVTYEGYDEGLLFSVENCVKDPDFLKNIKESTYDIQGEKQTFSFVRKSNKAFPEGLPKEYISRDLGMMDEAFAYADMSLRTLSICLPCQGNMHSDTCVKVRQPSFEGYINALECFVYEMTKTHSELMKAKEIENQTFLERVQELVKQEKEDSKKYASQYSSYFTNGTDYYESYTPRYSGYTEQSDDYYFGSPADYDLDVEYIAQAGYEMAPNYDEDSKELFIQDMIEGTYPELLEKLSILKQQFGTIFDDYFENIKDLEKEDEDNDYSGYVDDLE